MKNRLLRLLFLLTASTAMAQQSYQMACPFEVIARNGVFDHTKAGSERDMRTALQMAQSGNPGQALDIINAYANTLS